MNSNTIKPVLMISQLLLLIVILFRNSCYYTLNPKPSLVVAIFFSHYPNITPIYYCGFHVLFNYYI